MNCFIEVSVLLITFQASEIVVKADRPNVVLIIFDDLRPAISGYGDPLARTPNIDKFMTKSFYFTRAYCQQALCAPSRNSMLTGRRPDTLHLYDFYSYWRTFAGNFTTLPQYFKDNGYHTYSIGKVFHPGISSNFTDDFPLSWSEQTFHPSTEAYMNSPVCPNGSRELKSNLICPVRVKSQPGKTLPDIESVLEAKRFLDENNKNSTKPYLLAVGFHKPHVPFRIPRKYFKYFPRSRFNCSVENKPDGMPIVAWNPYADVRKRDDSQKLNIPFPFGPIPQDFQISIRQAYYTAVGYVDSLFGALMNSIDLKRTVVIVTGDHGWSLGEHAEWAKFSNFEIAVRVPLIVYSPEFKLKQSKELRNIVELVDVFPTVIDLAHLPKLKKCEGNPDLTTCGQGHSLYNLINTGRSSVHRVALSQYPRPGVFPTLYPNSDKPKLLQIKVMGYSIRTGNFRYTLWVKFYPQNFTKDWDTVYGEELYDNECNSTEDVNEVENPKFQGIRKRLRHRLINGFS